MDEPKFYNPDTGIRIKARETQVACSDTTCVAYQELIPLWDLGTGVFCGACSGTLIPPSPEDMVPYDTTETEVPAWLAQ